MSDPRAAGVQPARTRTFSWEDPLLSAEAGRRMSGLEFIRAFVTGELPPPPIAKALAFAVTEADDGRVVFVCQPAEFHYNPIGVVHGGLAATLLDSAMGCAIQTTLPAGVGYTTLEIKVNLTRVITTQTGELRAEGRVIHAGKRTALAEGRLTDAAGTLYAHATTTCMIFRP